MKMIVEQTSKYPKRMLYQPQSNCFIPSEDDSLAYVRGFPYPYGWIKESGTPPEPHCDCILLSRHAYELGDEVAIKLIGVFKRADGDHKYIAVEVGRTIEDYSQLTEDEIGSLKKLYPRIRAGEGWFGRDEAVYWYEHGEKAL